MTYEANSQQQKRTLPRLHDDNFCMRNNRCGDKIRDILQSMGLFPIIPKRIGLNIPHLRSYVPRMEITQTQIISDHSTNAMKIRSSYFLKLIYCN